MLDKDYVNFSIKEEFSSLKRSYLAQKNYLRYQRDQEDVKDLIEQFNSIHLELSCPDYGPSGGFNDQIAEAEMETEEMDRLERQQVIMNEFQTMRTALEEHGLLTAEFERAADQSDFE